MNHNYQGEDTNFFNQNRVNRVVSSLRNIAQPIIQQEAIQEAQQQYPDFSLIPKFQMAGEILEYLEPASEFLDKLENNNSYIDISYPVRAKQYKYGLDNGNYDMSLDRLISDRNDVLFHYKEPFIASEIARELYPTEMPKEDVVGNYISTNLKKLTRNDFLKEKKRREQEIKEQEQTEAENRAAEWKRHKWLEGNGENLLNKKVWIDGDQYRVSDFRDWGRNSWELTKLNDKGEDEDFRDKKHKIQINDETLQKIIVGNQDGKRGIYYLKDKGLFRQRYKDIDEGSFDREIYYNPDGTTMQDYYNEHPEKHLLLNKGDRIGYIPNNEIVRDGIVSDKYLDKEGNLFYTIKGPITYNGYNPEESLSVSDTVANEMNNYAIPLTQKQQDDYKKTIPPYLFGPVSVTGFKIPKEFENEKEAKAFINSAREELGKQGVDYETIDKRIANLENRINETFGYHLGSNPQIETPEGNDTKVENVTPDDSVTTESGDVVPEGKEGKEGVRNAGSKGATKTKVTPSNNSNDDNEESVDQLFYNGGEIIPKKRSGGTFNQQAKDAIRDFGAGLYETGYGVANAFNNWKNNRNDFKNWSYKYNTNAIAADGNPFFSGDDLKLAQTFNNLNDDERNVDNLLGSAGNMTGVMSMYYPTWQNGYTETVVEDLNDENGTNRCGGLHKYQTAGSTRQEDVIMQDKYKGPKLWKDILSNIYNPAIRALGAYGNLRNEQRYYDNGDYSQLAQTFEPYIGYPMEQVNSLGDINTYSINGRQMTNQIPQLYYE